MTGRHRRNNPSRARASRAFGVGDVGEQQVARCVCARRISRRAKSFSRLRRSFVCFSTECAAARGARRACIEGARLSSAPVIIVGGGGEGSVLARVKGGGLAVRRASFVTRAGAAVDRRPRFPVRAARLGGRTASTMRPAASSNKRFAARPVSCAMSVRSCASRPRRRKRRRKPRRARPRPYCIEQSGAAQILRSIGIKLDGGRDCFSSSRTSRNRVETRRAGSTEMSK